MQLHYEFSEHKNTTEIVILGSSIIIGIVPPLLSKCDLVFSRLYRGSMNKTPLKDYGTIEHQKAESLLPAWTEVLLPLKTFLFLAIKTSTVSLQKGKHIYFFSSIEFTLCGRIHRFPVLFWMPSCVPVNPGLPEVNDKNFTA